MRNGVFALGKTLTEDATDEINVDEGKM